jgi:3-hydroxyisobutyrate dehydrogenase-like beta-hydroxyacid dehydrogenase
VREFRYREVLAGAQASKKGLIHVEMSTMHPTFQKKLGGRLAAAGIEMLDAPISGSHDKADSRTITFMVGGKPEVFERVRPILEPLAADVSYIGPCGSGAMLSQMGERIFNRDFVPRGAVEIFAKDMGIAIDLAKELGIDLQIVPAARKMFQRAEAAGWGKDDASRVIEVYEGKDLKK